MRSGVYFWWYYSYASADHMPSNNSLESVITLPERITDSKLSHCCSLLKNMAHPLRISILDLLHQCERLNVTQIYQRLGVEQAVASHHISLLRENGLVNVERIGKHAYYSLADLDVKSILVSIESCTLVNGSEN